MTMKTQTPRFLILLLLISSLLTACSQSAPSIGSSQSQSPQLNQQMPTKEEMMALWKEFSTPGESHKALNRMTGKWDHTVTWWMEPGAAPEKSRGKSDIHWTLGGRFLEHQVTGKFMGKPFQGRGIIGFDNATKEYRTIWIDNMGTGMMIGTAKFDKASNSLQESGSGSCPVSGTVSYRSVTTFIDANHFKYEMFMTPPGTSETKVMNIDYSRVKKG